jgi:sulfur carrier protein
MEITVNRQPFSLPESATIGHLLSALLQVSASGTAVAVNQSVVAKPDWEKHVLQAGDQVMLIKATQGG